MGETLSVVIPFTHQDNTAACGFDVPRIRESLAVKRFSRHLCAEIWLQSKCLCTVSGMRSPRDFHEFNDIAKYVANQGTVSVRNATHDSFHVGLFR